MWFTIVTARLFHSLSFQPRLAATLLSSCSVANNRIRRGGTLTRVPVICAGAATEPIGGKPSLPGFFVFLARYRSEPILEKSG